MYYLVSILFGLIPEVLYFTLFITYTKNLKEKRIKLFLLLSISYFLCVLIQQWTIFFYLLSIVLFYIDLKFIYKNKVQIIDVFIISISCFYITFLSFLLIFLVKQDMSNYMYIYLLDKILLFIPFVFKNKFNKAYKKYCEFWNRNDYRKRPIKSITLRNISLILLNGIILFMNITISNIVNFIIKWGVKYATIWFLDVFLRYRRWRVMYGKNKVLFT